MDNRWTPEEAMKVWGDLEYIEEHGHWKTDVQPKWFLKLSKRLQISTKHFTVLIMVAYKKCAETFIDEYIKAGKK